MSIAVAHCILRERIYFCNGFGVFINIREVLDNKIMLIAATLRDKGFRVPITNHNLATQNIKLLNILKMECLFNWFGSTKQF